MTEIRGKYLYDLTTLTTVGKATDNISKEEKQDYNYMPGYCISTGGYSGILFSLLKGVKESEKMGTVEQLSFEQMITLFMQGDMVVEELKIGLESKWVTDVTSTVQDGMTTVTFTYDNKVFTLKCATDAAASQIDDKTAEITDDSITTTFLIEETGHFTLYEQVLGYSEPEAGGLVFKHMEPDIEEPVFAYLYYVFMPAVNKHLGYNFQGINPMFSKLTDEDKKYINEHPEIFHYHFQVGANGQFTGSEQIDPDELDRFVLENGGYQMTPEEYYSYLVTQFAKYGVIYRSSDDYGCWNACELYVQYAGDGNVKFTEDTVELLMADFKRWPDLNSGMIQLLGVTAQDDKETIWKKIEFFCKSLGSDDGKTISAEKLYLLLGCRTYDEVVDDMEKESERANCPRKENPTPTQPNMTVIGDKGITLTDEDIEAAREQLDEASQENDIAARTKAYLQKLKEQYPDINEGLLYALEEWYNNDLLLGSHESFRLDWYIDSNNDIGYGDVVNGYLLNVLQFAAGVDTKNDSYKTQREKLAALAKSMGATADGYITEIDFEKMMNYLLGDNNEKINYFASFDKIPSEHNYYTVKVSTPEELLYYMKNYRGVNIQLMNDIDLTNYPWETIEEFYGTISGQYELNDEYNRCAQYTITVGDTPFIKDAMGAGLVELTLAGKTDNFVLNNYDSVFNIYIQTGYTEDLGPEYKLYTPENLVQKGTSSADIPVVPYQEPESSWSRDINTKYPEVYQNMVDDIKSRLKSISREYLVCSNGKYENLYHCDNDEHYNNPDSDYYNYSLNWINEDVKNAFTQDMLKIAEEILAEYSDIITSIGFDGQSIVFTTIHDPQPQGYPNTICASTFPESIGMQTFILPSIANPIMLTEPPKVIPNNIPDELPVDTEGRCILKTLYDGIYVSTDPRGKGVYIWDSIEQKYIKLDEDDWGRVYSIPRNGDPSELFKGNDAINSWEDPYLDLLIASLVYGYNRTENPTIFEKNGKYYQLTQSKYSWMIDYGLEGFERCLVEIKFNTSDSATIQPAATAPARTQETGQEASNTQESTETETETETETPPANNVETENTEDDFYASLAKKIEIAAIELGYEKGDDGNYYFNQGNNTYLCLWNYWTNSFDKYLVATAEDDEVQLDVNSKGDFQASENTLESLFAESILIAQKYEMTPTKDTGVFELNNERYVFDINRRMFVKEVDAVKNNVRTWVQVYHEALKLASILRYQPSSIAFCIFEDNEGNHFKYDADEQTFVEYNA